MNYPDNKTFYTRNITISYFIEFFSSLYFLIPVWIAFELRYLSLSQLATIEIVVFASQLILELPTGAFADLLGKKSTIFLGMTILGISFVFFGFSNSYIDFIIVASLMGLGSSLVSGAKEALLFDTLKQVGKEKDFTKISSKLNFVFQSGMAAATLAGGFLGTIYFRLPLIATGIAILIAGFFVLFLFEPSVDTEKFTLSSYINQTKKGFGELFKTKYSSLISIFYGLVGGITFPVAVVFTKLILTELSFSNTQMGVIFSIIRIFNGFVLFAVVNKTKILNRTRSFLLFAILIPLVFLPGIFFTKNLVLPFVFLMMTLSTARWVLLGKYTNEVFSSKNRATAISSLSMFVGIIYIMAMFISGPVMEQFSSSKAMFTLLGLISLMLITPIGIYISRMHITNTTQAFPKTSAL